MKIRFLPVVTLLAAISFLGVSTAAAQTPTQPPASVPVEDDATDSGDSRVSPTPDDSEDQQPETPSEVVDPDLPPEADADAAQTSDADAPAEPPAEGDDGDSDAGGIRVTPGNQ
jgi:hypothetical protein